MIRALTENSPRRVDDLLLAFPSAQRRMDHIALDRPGPDNGHLDDEIV